MVSPNQELRRRWLEPLCRGESWAGVAFGGLRAGPAQVSVRPASGGWTLHGLLPQITGWRLIDVVMISARTEDDRRVVSMLLPAEPAPGMVPEPLTLIAANASSTVRLRLDGVFVPSSNVMSNWPYVPPPEYDGGGRPNGSLSLGVARRCLRLMGAGPLDSELEARRRQLDEAKDRDLAGARAAAAGLALRAAAALIVSQGSTSILAGQHAQRLYREAAFLLVFGSRPATRTALLRRLGAAVDAS
jgi:alkylation response protein AidB-like acyl-CoA dehydrogenase